MGKLLRHYKTNTNANIIMLAFAAPTMLSLNTPARANVKATVALNNKAAKSTEFCYGLPGAIEPIPQGFDPANLLEGVSKEEVYRWREAELTHGRVGMLASAGFLVQEKFHPLFSADGGPAIEQIPKLPVPLWFGMTLAITAIEAKRIQLGFAPPTEANLNDARKGGQSQSFQRLNDDYVPGQLGF